MAINCGRRHQQRRRRGSGNAVDGVSSQSQTLSDSQGNVIDGGQSQTLYDSRGNVVDGVSSQSQTLSDSPRVKPVPRSSLSRRQQRHELVRRRKLREIERRRNSYQPSSSDSTQTQYNFYDITSYSDEGPYMVNGVPVPCDLCGAPHSAIRCPYFFWFPPDGHLLNQHDYAVVCECGRFIVDDRCPSGSCFPCRLRRVEYRNLDLSPPYDPAYVPANASW